METREREVLLKVRDLEVTFGNSWHRFNAVKGVSFDIYKGETFGIVGESGSGKTTIGRCIIRVYPASAGSIQFKGREITGHISKELDREITQKIQMIFQDPMASLNERAKIDYIVSEGLQGRGYTKAQIQERVTAALHAVGLPPEFATRFPHEFSGGQRQRICIARALALNPEFVVCDEPVSALDVSIQAQIINLLKELQDKYNLTYLFISHDLSVVEHISDTVGVMYLGNLVEYGATPDIFSHPLHPYTKALFSAIPIPDPTIRRERIVLQGSIPSPANPPKGCKFHTRCPYATERCKTEAPQQREVEPGHYVVCHLYEK